MEKDSPPNSFISGETRKADWVIVYDWNIPISPYILQFSHNLQTQGALLETKHGHNPNNLYLNIHFPDKTIEYFSKMYNIDLSNPGHNYISTSTLNLQFTRLQTNDNRNRFKRLGGATTKERIMIGYEILKETKFGDGQYEYGVNKLKALGVIKAAYPLHDSHYQCDENTEKQWMSDRQFLYKYWSNFSLWYKQQPLNLIEKYYGKEVAFYFAWLGFYNQMLVPAAIVGLVCFLISVVQLVAAHNYRAEDICNSDFIMCPICHTEYDCIAKPLNHSCVYAKISVMFDNYSTVFFAIFMSFWATVFLNRWRRFESLLKIRWNVEDEKMDTKIRQAYKESATYKKISLVTGKIEPYVPTPLKFLRMTLSYGTCLLFLTIVLLALFIAIMVKISMATLFEISSSDHLESPGAVVVACASAALQVIFIKLIGMFYAQISTLLTKLENPRTQTEFDRGVVYKRYFLGFANNYIPLFYIAFFKGQFYTPMKTPSQTKIETDICHPCGCLMALCLQVFFLMVMSSLIGNILRLTCPKITKCMKSNKYDDIPQWEEEFNLLPTHRYLMTTQFMKMIIQYGFVTFFVAAFPLAPLFALINNCLELRLDAYDLVARYRRPVPKKQPGIGAWNDILEMITHIGVATNAFVLAFTSDFVAREIYKYQHDNSLDNYIQSTLSMYDMKDYKGAYKEMIKGELEKMQNERNSTICYYRGLHHPPGHPNQYKLTPEFWYELGIRLLCVIVFEHVIWVSNGILSYFIPDVPITVKQKMHHDKIMEQNFKMKLMSENNKKIKDNLKTDLFQRFTGQ